jgi:hypothetical protein
MKQLRWRFALAALLAAPALGVAQDRSALLLRAPSDPNAMGSVTGRAQPGVASASPLGFGPNFRDVFGGVGYQAETRYGGDDDGAVSAGLGLGNSRTMVGVELVLTSLSTVRSGFGERMVASVKVHRELPHSFGIGVGAEGFKITGEDSFEPDPSFFVALSKVVRLSQSDFFSGATLNVGLGNERFQQEEDILAGEDGIGFFASAGIRIAPALGAIFDYTGQDLNLGLSIAPFSKIQLVITPGLADVLEQAGDGARFTLGAGLAWRF